MSPQTCMWEDIARNSFLLFETMELKENNFFQRKRKDQAENQDTKA